MKRTFTSFFFSAGLLLMLAAPGYGQGEAQSPLVVSLPQGGFALFKIEIARLNTNASTGAGTRELRLPLLSQALIGDVLVHRLLVDEAGDFVFGYDLLVEPLPAAGKFRVSARPLEREFETRLRARNTSQPRTAPKPFALSTLPRATDEQIVSDGETLALDLLVNERLGVKVVDYVRVAKERSNLFAPGAAPRRPRDFTITNAELAVKDYQLRIDGEALRTSGSRRSCAGALLWLYVPGKGRFIFSLAPHEGYDFRKIGVAEENKISFEWEGVRYEWISAAPVVGSGGTWNLWVLHDRAYADVFTPRARLPREEESGAARVLRDPVGAIAERMGDGRRGIQTRGRASTGATERVRVLIGAAASIETLLPKS